MICIVGDRRSGKTTALIKMSAETGIPIFAPNHGMARSIERQAKSMGVSIPDPEVFTVTSTIGRFDRRVMIDEAQMILRRCFGIEVVCVTFDRGYVDLKDMTLRELLCSWWRARRANDADGKASLSS